MSRLTHLALLVPCVALLPACDATAPKVGSARLYQLAAVDSLSLPAVISASNGDTTSLISATLTLDDTQHALTVTQYHYNYANAPDTTVTVAYRAAWRQHGDSIEVGHFGRCRDLCPLNEIGTAIGPEITLTVGTFQTTAPVYHYQLAVVY